MSQIVYRISALLGRILADAPVGTNLGQPTPLFAFLPGRFLPARGAVFTALSSLGLCQDAVRRAAAALAYGRFELEDLLCAWQQIVREEGRFRFHRYEGYSPVACDLTGFFRPRL